MFAVAVAVAVAVASAVALVSCCCWWFAVVAVFSLVFGGGGAAVGVADLGDVAVVHVVGVVVVAIADPAAVAAGVPPAVLLDSSALLCWLHHPRFKQSCSCPDVISNLLLLLRLGLNCYYIDMLSQSFA